MAYNLRSLQKGEISDSEEEGKTVKFLRDFYEKELGLIKIFSLDFLILLQIFSPITELNFVKDLFQLIEYKHQNEIIFSMLSKGLILLNLKNNR